MIARTWKGAVRSEDANDYAAYMRATGVADYAATPGNRGAWMLRRDAGDRTEFVMVTLWDAIDALEAFAGEDYDRAVFYPEDERFLIERDRRATHYQVAASVDGSAWNPTENERSRVFDFLAVYRAAFEALDAGAIADLFANPLQIGRDAGGVDVATVASREAWLPQIEQLVAAYRTIGVRDASPDSAVDTYPSPRTPSLEEVDGSSPSEGLQEPSD